MDHLYVVFSEQIDGCPEIGDCYDTLLGVFLTIDNAEKAINDHKQTSKDTFRYYIIETTPDKVVKNCEPIKVM